MISSLSLRTTWTYSSCRKTRKFKRSWERSWTRGNQNDSKQIERNICGKYMKADLFQTTIKMTETTSTTLNGKLMEFQKKNIVIKRNATADVLMKSGWKYSYSYSSYDFIWEQIWKELNELKILVSHAIQDYSETLFLETTITDLESWETKQSMIPLSKDIDPQKMGSAITYFKRYNLGALLNLIIEWEDDDGATATKKPVAKNATTTKKPEFLDANFENFKNWTKWKKLDEIISKKNEIMTKYTISEAMIGKLNDFLSSL